MFRALFLALAFAMLVALFPLAAQNGNQPSFDCTTARHPVEQIICNDAELADADARMAKLYAAAATSAFGKGKSNQLAVQREWISIRNHCGRHAGPIAKQEDSSKDGAVECVRSNYRERNNQLAVAVLLDNPDLALATLRKDSPQVAPLYEALALYMGSADGKKRDRIIVLLRPFFADMGNDADRSYGNAVLGGVATSPEDSISSDSKFAATLSILTAYIDDADHVAGGLFPCAALIRRPDMISAIQPYFGSTLDNFLMRDDCEQTLPAQPRFHALRTALDSFWDQDDCGGGTIRFAVYRSFAAQMTSAQIGHPVGDTKQASLTRKGLKPQLVSAALAELVDQYQRYRGLTKVEADKRARVWLGAMISSAGKCYDE
jgi:uncharacterized protein YecT (DUF1311 family)